MALMELIQQAQQREQQREQAREQAERERDMTRFTNHLTNVFGETFVSDIGGQIGHDGTAHVRTQYSGDTYRIYLRHNPDASYTWMVNDNALFVNGRHPGQQEAIDTVALAIAELAESEPEPEQEQPTPETVRLQETAEQPQ